MSFYWFINSKNMDSLCKNFYVIRNLVSEFEIGEWVVGTLLGIGAMRTTTLPNFAPLINLCSSILRLPPNFLLFPPIFFSPFFVFVGAFWCVGFELALGRPDHPPSPPRQFQLVVLSSPPSWPLIHLFFLSMGNPPASLSFPVFRRCSSFSFSSPFHYFLPFHCFFSFALFLLFHFFLFCHSLSLPLFLALIHFLLFISHFNLFF